MKTSAPLVLAVLASSSLPRASAQSYTPTACNIPYVQNSSQHLLDVYIPSAPPPVTPRPVVMYIHGGGWQTGCKYPIPPTCEHLIDAGIAIVSVQYRFTNGVAPCAHQPAGSPCTQSPVPDGPAAPFPAQIHDVKAAVRWIHSRANLEHPTWNLDVERIGVHGVSAGGHLAMLLATSNGESAVEGTLGYTCGEGENCSSVAIASAWAPPTDFFHFPQDAAEQATVNVLCPDWYTCEALNDLFGWPAGLQNIIDNWTNMDIPYPTLAQLVREASPTYWVDGNEPPMFFAHGTLDGLAPTNQSTRLSAALYDHDVWHDFRPFPQTAHHGPPPPPPPPAPSTIDPYVEFYTRFYAGFPLNTPSSTMFCFGDGIAPATGCPCGNDSFPGAREGCKNAQVISSDVYELLVGANLDARGLAIVGNDRLALRADGMGTSDVAVFWQGTLQESGGSGTPFGNGLMCIGGTLVRIGTKTSTHGYAQYPAAGDLPVSIKGGVTGGQTRFYQVQYMHSPATCVSGAVNATNAIQIVW